MRRGRTSQPLRGAESSNSPGRPSGPGGAAPAPAGLRDGAAPEPALPKTAARTHQPMGGARRIIARVSPQPAPGRAHKAGF